MIPTARVSTSAFRTCHRRQTKIGPVLHRNLKRQNNRSCLPPTWTIEELGKRASIERVFGRVFSLFSPFCLQCPSLVGWTAVETRVALAYAATLVVGLAAQQAGRPDLTRSPTRVLAHTWEGLLK